MGKKFSLHSILIVVVLVLSGCSNEGEQPDAAISPTKTIRAESQQPTQTSTQKILTSTRTPTQEPSSTVTATPLPPIPEDILFSIGDPYAGELGSKAIDVLQYDLAIKLNPGITSVVEGRAELTVEALYTPLDVVVLDFEGYEIHSLTVDGIEAAFSRSNGKLIIETLLPFIEGEQFQIVVEYSGRPKEESSRFVPFVDHLGVFFRSASNVFVLSEPDGSHYWFPCNDHLRDKALFNISITVPEDFMAVANGNLVSSVINNDGTKEFQWEHAYPMSPYLSAFAVGYYEQVTNFTPSGFEIVSYVFEDTTPGFETEMKDIAEALDWFSELLIPYPYDTFGFVVVDGFGASLETQSMVVLDESMISEFVMIHELVHMWFGDWVSLDSWGEMWRNEGVTNYFSLLWLFRDDPETLMSYMEVFEADAMNWENTEPLNDLSPGNLFGREAYDFAMLVTHKLRLEVGDEAFFEGFRVYLERYGGGTASDAEFIAVMEEVSGMDLTDFFDYWLNYSSASALK